MSIPLRMDDLGLLVTCPACQQVNRIAFSRIGGGTRCGRCKASISATGQPLDVATVADFDRLLAAVDLQIVVDFWAPWCGPCRMVAPELETVAARSNGRFLMIKVNTDALPELQERYQIQSIPTMAVFAGGRETGRTMGARPAADIERFIVSSRVTP